MDERSGLTKSQLKKQAKRDRIQAKYKEKKLAAKKAKLVVQDETEHERIWGPRQERNAMTRADFESNCDRGPVMAIDCDWDDMMTDKERLSLTQQIMYSYAINRKATKPVRMCLYGVSARQQELLKKLPGFDTWYIVTTSLPLASVAGIQKSGIYLTADTEDMLELSEINRDRTLIIGGIVDRNRHKNATVDKADALGIRTAQLPIGDLMAMKTSKVLTVNHVFEIVTEVLSHADWSKALDKVIPDRKRDIVE
jgi:tRNA (guanine9-N1)-methyltransferase